MSDTPTVSVILPVYNRLRELRASIASVLNQTFRDLELIVVDDGSSEDVAGLTRALGDARVRYIRRENGGPAAARNTGMRLARGKYVAFQDSDDEWLPDKLALQLGAAEAGSANDMVVCGLRRIAAQRVRTYPLTSAGVLTREQVLRRPIAYAQTWLVRREHVTGAGGFDETLRVWDDWELLIRLSAQVRVRVLPTVLVNSPVRADGISRDQERFADDMRYILAKHEETLRPMPHIRAELEYQQGRLLGSMRRLAAARRAFLRTLQGHPGHWRAALLAVATFGGPGFFQWVLTVPWRGR